MPAGDLQSLVTKFEQAVHVMMRVRRERFRIQVYSCPTWVKAYADSVNDIYQ